MSTYFLKLILYFGPVNLLLSTFFLTACSEISLEDFLLSFLTTGDKRVVLSKNIFFIMFFILFSSLSSMLHSKTQDQPTRLCKKSISFIYIFNACQFPNIWRKAFFCLFISNNLAEMKMDKTNLLISPLCKFDFKAFHNCFLSHWHSITMLLLNEI